MSSANRQSILDNECLMICNSGEIPEVARHNALHDLTRDPDGPGMKRQPDEIQRLREAVLRRYRRIVLRDLDPHLRDKSVCRGMRRSISNWERLSRFAARERIAIQGLRNEIAAARGAFLEREITDVAAGKRVACINCGLDRLLAFGTAVGFDFRRRPSGWPRYLDRS